MRTQSPLSPRADVDAGCRLPPAARRRAPPRGGSGCSCGLRSRCAASGRPGRGHLESSKPMLQASQPQRVRHAVVGAPFRCRRPSRSAPPQPAGQTQSRRQGSGERRNSGSGVRGANSLPPDSKGPHHHPSSSGHGDGGRSDLSVLQTPRLQHHSRPQLQRRCELSYKDVLLRQCGSDCHGGRCLPLTDEVSAGAQVHGLGVSEEGWQAVKIKRPRSSRAPQSDKEACRKEERRSLYLRKMKGRCFNCLARDHKVGACRDPMRCWQCCCYGHISTDCPLRCSELPPSRMKEDSALMPTCTGACTFVDDSLIQFKHSSPLAACESSFDPMVMEASLMMQMLGGGVGSSTPKTATPSPVSIHLSFEERLKHNQPIVDIVQTPLIVRCEEEKLVGHELLKALSNFKHAVITPLSHSIRHTNSSEKKSAVVPQEGNMHISRHEKLKTKTLKPGLKMVRNMLTKKWVVVRKKSKDKQLIALAKFLKALRWPP